ncbi:MAG: PIN domain-containing protein [Polyangiaceae bacterium]|nr:PIN domain-containing protein [Polyangiaceae bacterium]MCW5790478.1 PIN domain-containing protein [Polyangiaceae bacterium]
MTVVDTNVISRFLHREARSKYPIEHGFVEGLIQAGELAVSYVTHFELRRGIEELVLRGEGRRRLVGLEKLIERVEVLGLDVAGGRGWLLAARLWARGRAVKPAINFSEADLLIATTAAIHGRPFATSERRLAENLRQIGFPSDVWVVPVSTE